MADKAMFVRQLVPKSYHFDGYDLVDCRNTRDRPFFGDCTVPMGEYMLTIRRLGVEKISLEFESVCKNGMIYFEPYELTINEFVSKLKSAVETGSDYIYFEIIPVYDKGMKVCNCQSKDCKRMVEYHPTKVMAAVSFDVKDIKRALSGYYGIVKPTTERSNIMKKKNNFMGVNFEFGPSKDSNIAATLLGVAVRDGYNGPWYTYDPAKKTIKNLANVKLGNLPIWLLPVAKANLKPGDLIKEKGKYFWIQSITEDGTFKAAGVPDGMVHELLPQESIIPGLSLYTKVVAMDVNSLTDANGNGTANNLLAAMLMMQWSKGDSDTEFSLDDINDDSFNGMGSMLPLILAQSSGGNIGNIFGGDNGQINLPMLMMLGGGDSEEGGFMQMYVLSQILNPGGTTGLEGLIPGIGGNQNAAVDQAVGEDKVICQKCNIEYPAGTNFCPKCGGKTRSIGAVCSKCGVKLMPGAAFCHKCGAKVGPETCPGCGSEVPDGAAFCPKCGHNLNEKKSEETVAEEQKKPEEKKE